MAWSSRVGVSAPLYLAEWLAVLIMKKYPILLNKHYDEATIFTPDNLLREARRQKSLPMHCRWWLSSPVHGATVKPHVCAAGGTRVKRLTI